MTTGFIVFIIFFCLMFGAVIFYILEGCSHVWEVIDKTKFTRTEEYQDGHSYENDYTLYIQKCKKCGKLKSCRL